VDVNLLLQLLIKLLGVLSPSEIDTIKKEIAKMEEQYAKDRQEALVAIESGDVAALNRIINKLLDMSET
jgi:hypothetical protein